MAKQEKVAEKAKKAEEDRMTKEERRKSKEAPVVDPTVPAVQTASHDDDELYQDSSTAAHTIGNESADPTSPRSQGSSKGFKSLISKLKRRSKHASGPGIEDRTQDKEAGFIGGAALRSSQPQSHSSTVTSTPQADSTASYPPADLGDVEPIYVPHVGTVSHSDVSSLSSAGEEDDRGRPAERIVSGETTKSGGTDFEEARDHFDTELAPPPTFTSDAGNARKGSPSRDSKFHEVGL